jgi:hypothetical protein
MKRKSPVKRRRQKPLSQGCCLFVCGEKFDVDSFLAKSPLRKLADIFYRGQPFVAPKGKLKKHSGFSVLINETKFFGDLRPQIPAALKFVRKEQKELARLAKFPGATELFLEFPCVRPEGTYGCETFPSELLALASSCRIGIRLSFY